MRLSPSCLAIMAVALITGAAAVGPTDTYSDADVMQSGYLPNHNMDPAVVDSAQFGLLWKIPFNAKEQFYAKPLTYTPLAGGPQLLFLASSQNWIRTLNAKTGALVNARQVHSPFLQSDIGCTDIPNTIGIIGTPVIDPNTDTAYFYAKTYIPNYRYAGNTGTYNGVYYFHGVNVNTLEDRWPPVLVDGSVADNDPRKYFIGGIVLQRPSLLQSGNVVYAAFGGHCDLFNYTGAVIGVDVTTQKVVTQFVTEAGPLVPQTNVWNQNAGGGQGGIWMAGMALSSDGNRLFFVTGNGNGHQNDGSPASGSSGCPTLGEAIVNLGIGPGGVLRQTDYFQPYDYQNMDGGDQDLGSGGVVLLDPGTFKGTGVSKMAVTCGKNGKIYIMNANNLGGYKLGPGQTDNVIQVLTTNKAIFGGAGSYPLEGGYLYSTPVGYPTYVYKLGFSAGGVPSFYSAGQTTEVSAGRVGSGVPTITSNKGQAGTGILWLTDPDAGLRAWYAVPQNGVMKSIKLPAVNGLNKFQRPVFGDGRLYVTDGNGVLYCLGSPVTLPLNCTSPVQFGDVALGSQANQTVTCKALIALTQINGMTVGDNHFVVKNSTLPQGPVAAGTVFTFPVTWDLRGVTVQDKANASYGNTQPGIKSTALTIYTTNSAAGYSTLLPISLSGNEVSQSPYLSVSPTTVDYGGIVLRPNASVPSVSQPIVIQNSGLGPMTLSGYAYGSPLTNVTFNPDGSSILGHGFTSTNLPPPNTVLQRGQQISVDTKFSPVDGIGSYVSYLYTYSDGGVREVTLEGSASTAPVANFSISTSEGGWLPDANLDMNFGSVAPGSSSSRMIRICNVGGSVLKISKSKPPNGAIHIDDPAALHEEQEIAIGACAYGTVLFVAPTAPYNAADQTITNSWTLNTDDLNFGVHVANIFGTVVSKHVGPTNSSNLPVYTYLGCYKEPAGPRLLNKQVAGGSNNTNGNCQETCLTNVAGGYAFAGTEYETECFCGNVPPPSAQLDTTGTHCTFACPGDKVDSCGGDGGYISIFYDGTKYRPGDAASTPTGGPITVNETGSFNYIGCYSEATNGRALQGKAPPAPANGHTIETCQAACSAFTYFGMEFSNECYCGNTIFPGSAAQASSDPAVNNCNMLCDGNQTEYCGGPGRLNMYALNSSAPISSPSATGSVAPTPTPIGPITVGNFDVWSYLGCYSEATNMRALSDKQNPIAATAVSVEACGAACAAYGYFGVEYSGECFCGNTINPGSALQSGQTVDVTGCNMLCKANATEYCGGGSRLNMYRHNSAAVSTTVTPSATPITNATATATTTATPTPTGPITVTQLAGYNYLGCWSETSTGPRALSDKQNPIPGTSVSVENCAAACAGYTYFGVEYAAECYCGNTINTGSALVAGSTVSDTKCNMLCKANALEYCGGPSRLNMYQVAPPSATSTTVATTPTTPATSGTITPVATTSVVVNTTTSVFTTTTPITTTSLLNSPVIDSTTTVTTSPLTTTLAANSTTTTSTATTSSATPSATPSNPWVYLGCANETNPRALNNAGYTNTTSMTVESCQSYCATNNYGLAGLEFKNQCFCGNALQQNSQVGFPGCTLPCSGNASQICGGNSRLSVYNLTTFVPPSTVKSVGPYASKGCYKEATTGRLLPGPTYVNATGMTVESCVGFCAAQKPPQPYAGVEFGQECFCGTTLPATAVGAAPERCGMLCSGNKKEFCGAGGYLGVYYNDPNAVPAPTKRALRRVL